jgi:hypothetical protein
MKMKGMHWLKVFTEFALIASAFGAIECGNQCEKSSSRKYSIEELLSTKYEYTDPRTDYQLDMDPCKSGNDIFPF